MNHLWLSGTTTVPDQMAVSRRYQRSGRDRHQYNAIGASRFLPTPSSLSDHCFSPTWVSFGRTVFFLFVQRASRYAYVVSDALHHRRCILGEGEANTKWNERISTQRLREMQSSADGLLHIIASLDDRGNLRRNEEPHKNREQE